MNKSRTTTDTSRSRNRDKPFKVVGSAAPKPIQYAAERRNDSLQRSGPELSGNQRGGSNTSGAPWRRPNDIQPTTVGDDTASRADLVQKEKDFPTLEETTKRLQATGLSPPPNKKSDESKLDQRDQNDVKEGTQRSAHRTDGTWRVESSTQSQTTQVVKDSERGQRQNQKHENNGHVNQNRQTQQQSKGQGNKHSQHRGSGYRKHTEARQKSENSTTSQVYLYDEDERSTYRPNGGKNLGNGRPFNTAAPQKFSKGHTETAKTKTSDADSNDGENIIGFGNKWTKSSNQDQDPVVSSLLADSQALQLTPDGGDKDKFQKEKEEKANKMKAQRQKLEMESKKKRDEELMEAMSGLQNRPVEKASTTEQPKAKRDAPKLYSEVLDPTYVHNTNTNEKPFQTERQGRGSHNEFHIHLSRTSDSEDLEPHQGIEISAPQNGSGIHNHGWLAHSPHTKMCWEDDNGSYENSRSDLTPFSSAGSLLPAPDLPVRSLASSSKHIYGGQRSNENVDEAIDVKPPADMKRGMSGSSPLVDTIVQELTRKSILQPPASPFKQETPKHGAWANVPSSSPRPFSHTIATRISEQSVPVQRQTPPLSRQGSDEKQVIEERNDAHAYESWENEGSSLENVVTITTVPHSNNPAIVVNTGPTLLTELPNATNNQDAPSKTPESKLNPAIEPVAQSSQPKAPEVDSSEKVEQTPSNHTSKPKTIEIGIQCYMPEGESSNQKSEFAKENKQQKDSDEPSTQSLPRANPNSHRDNFSQNADPMGSRDHSFQSRQESIFPSKHSAQQSPAFHDQKSDYSTSHASHNQPQRIPPRGHNLQFGTFSADETPRTSERNPSHKSRNEKSFEEPHQEATHLESRKVPQPNQILNSKAQQSIIQIPFSVAIQQPHSVNREQKQNAQTNTSQLQTSLTPPQPKQDYLTTKSASQKRHQVAGDQTIQVSNKPHPAGLMEVPRMGQADNHLEQSHEFTAYTNRQRPQDTGKYEPWLSTPSAIELYEQRAYTLHPTRVQQSYPGYENEHVYATTQRHTPSLQPAQNTPIPIYYPVTTQQTGYARDDIYQHTIPVDPNAFVMNPSYSLNVHHRGPLHNPSLQASANGNIHVQTKHMPNANAGAGNMLMLNHPPFLGQVSGARQSILPEPKIPANGAYGESTRHNANLHEPPATHNRFADANHFAPGQGQYSAPRSGAQRGNIRQVGGRLHNAGRVDRHDGS